MVRALFFDSQLEDLLGRCERGDIGRGAPVGGGGDGRDGSARRRLLAALVDRGERWFPPLGAHAGEDFRGGGGGGRVVGGVIRGCRQREHHLPARASALKPLRGAGCEGGGGPNSLEFGFGRWRRGREGGSRAATRLARCGSLGEAGRGLAECSAGELGGREVGGHRLCGHALLLRVMER